MNSYPLLQLFERISEAPEAIAQLRRFILDLAVRGKLVEQDPNDEPVEDLLKRIQAERVRLAKAGEIKTPKVLPPLTTNDEEFDLPTSWKWIRIRQVTSDRGQTVPYRDFTYIDVTAIDKEAGCISGTRVLAASDAPSRARKLVQTGDLIYSCVRPYLLNIAVIDGEFKPPAIASTAFAIVNGYGLVLSKYLWIVLRSTYMVRRVEENMRGQAYPAINESDFALLPIPLPPLAEQHHIVAKVDELMALCDELEAARDEREQTRDQLTLASLRYLNAPADDKDANTLKAWGEHARFVFANLPRITTRPGHIKQLRQAILNLAVRGKLVEQDRNDEPAEDLLKRIKAEKAQHIVRGRFNKHSPLGEQEIPFVIPNLWTWARLGEICSKTGSGSTPRGGKEIYVTSGIPFLRSQNVYDDGLNLEGIVYISNEIHERMNGSAVAIGDLLLNITGGSIGRCAIVPEYFETGNVSQHVAIIRPAIVSLNVFLHKVIVSSYFQSKIIVGQTGAGRGGLPKNRMDNIAVPLPPLAEQHRIVAKVDELMALCDQLEAQITITEANSRRLTEAAIHEALQPGMEEAFVGSSCEDGTSKNAVAQWLVFSS